MLLSKCAEHKLVITNTSFQQANKRKTTWMHPRSKQWHLIDYVIVKESDLKDVRITRSIRGAECWSDHLLVRSQMSLQIASKRHTSRAKPLKKLDVASLKDPDKATALQQSLDQVLDTGENEPVTGVSAETLWQQLRDTTYNTAADVLGFAKRKHQDWFDENDPDTCISQLLDEMHTTHNAYIADKNSPNKRNKYVHVKQKVQAKLRRMKDLWWDSKAAELQAAADRHDTKCFFDGLRAVYGKISIELLYCSSNLFAKNNF